MKKVLFITLDSPYIDRRTLLFAKASKEIGFQTSILTPYAEIEEGFEDIEIINLSSNEKRTKAVVTTKELLRKYSPAFLFNFAKKFYRKFFAKHGYIPFFEELIKTVRKIKADIYIACDLPALPIGYEGKITNKGLLIYDAHEFYTEQVALSDKEKAILSEIERNLIHNVDLLITVNEDIANLFKERYLYQNVKVILNATLCIKKQKNYLHDIIEINRNIPIVLYQGGFTPNRNLNKLVQLSSYLNRSVLVMLGWGTIEKDLKNKATDLNVLNRKIFFIPKISQAELLSYTSSASVGIIPYPAVDLNTKYCTPNKLFEYICAGIPIAVNKDLQTVNKLIQDYKIGFSIDLNDLKNSAEKIENLLKDKEKINFYKKNLEYAKGILNWEMEKKKVQNIFTELIRKSRRI